MNNDEPSGSLLLNSWHIMDLMVEVFPLTAPTPKHRIGHCIHSPLVGQEEDLLVGEDHLVEQIDVRSHPPLVHLTDYLCSFSLPSVVISHYTIWVDVPGEVEIEKNF